MIMPNSPDDTCDELDFSWECIAFEKDLMTIQLDFEEPGCISRSTEVLD